MPYSEIDWLGLWKELVLARKLMHSSKNNFSFNRRERAEAFEAGSRKKNKEKGDMFLDFIRADLKPGETVLDIGAGTGRWTVPLAEAAKKVTSIEPASAMLDILKKNVSEAGLGNVEIIQSSWESADVEPHDIAACAHAMYMSPDLAGFVRKMEKNAKRRCYMAMRLLPADGIMAELSFKIHKSRHDAPNFLIAYNALYGMGIYTNVLLEDSGYHWTDDNIESAFERAKKHLHLDDLAEYDNIILETLKRRLVLKDGVYHWPDGMRSALLWWDVKSKAGL